MAEFRPPGRDSGLRNFVVLYIAEGYKRNRNVVSLCNSDARVIEVAARWIGSLKVAKTIMAF